jgi:hypothetical protein
MNPSTRDKLLQVVERHEELGVLLSDPGLLTSINDWKRKLVRHG